MKANALGSRRMQGTQRGTVRNLHIRPARRWSLVNASNSFLSGITKVFGRQPNETKPDNTKQMSEQKSTVDRVLTGDSSKPIFPPYTVIKKTPEYSIRLYSVFPVIEMDYQRREEGYASLGGYIDGANDIAARFAYSQPVVMCYEPDGRKVMQMFLGPRRDDGGGPESDPAAATGGSGSGSGGGAAAITSLPAPSEAGLRVAVAGGEVVAVMQFEGYITPTSAEEVRRRLTASLRRDGIQLAPADAAGRFRCAQYGAVYQLGGRLNEMMLQVQI